MDKLTPRKLAIKISDIQAEEVELLRQLEHETDEEFNELVKVLREVRYVQGICMKLLALIKSFQSAIGTELRGQELIGVASDFGVFKKEFEAMQKYTPDLVRKEKMVFHIERLREKVLAKCQKFLGDEGKLLEAQIKAP